jgi:glutathione S-transferase
MLKLVIGDRNYSSWSLRPWLALKQAGLPFEETLIRCAPARTTKAEILKYSPSGKVPCLIDGERWSGTRWPSANTWPRKRRRCGRRSARRAPRRARSAPRCIPASCRLAPGHADGRARLEAVRPRVRRGRRRYRPHRRHLGRLPPAGTDARARSCSDISPSPTRCTRRSSGVS